MSLVRAAVCITGRVQGVWFRQSTKNIADKYNVKGWVRNNPDRSVEAILEGPRDSVQSVLDWCQYGPDLARVDELQVDWQKASGEFSDFKVR